MIGFDIRNKRFMVSEMKTAISMWTALRVVSESEEQQGAVVTAAPKKVYVSTYIPFLAKSDLSGTSPRIGTILCLRKLWNIG